MSVKIVRSIPQDIWSQFVYENPLGNIFHTPEMFEVFTKAQGYKPTLWAALDQDHNPLALLLPVQVAVLDGLMRRVTTRSIVYGGVLWKPGKSGRQALAKLMQTYIQQANDASLFTELRNLSDLNIIQPLLKENNFVYEPHLNYLINLNRSTESLFKDIGRHTRRNIRRALKRKQIEIREVVKLEKIPMCYAVLNKTYQFAQVPLADISLFEAAFEVLYPKGMIRFVSAYAGQVTVATSVELMYKDIVFGWYGGMDRAYRKSEANMLLTWHLLQWGAENGYRLFDFGGAGKPDEEYSVREFKAKFGGELVCYGRNIYVHKPKLLWLSKQGYKVLRRWL